MIPHSVWHTTLEHGARDASNSVGIQSRDARSRFALTEYRVVMVSRRRVVHLNVAGRFTFVLRGTLLLARLLRLVWLLRVRGFRGGYRRCADRRRDGCGASSDAMCFGRIRIIIDPFLEQPGSTARGQLQPAAASRTDKR